MEGVYRIRTGSSDETAHLGEALGRALRPGDLVALVGQLGSGKTVLVQGAARGLGFDGYVTSPTFVIVNEYEGRVPVFHVDLYRIADPRELEDIGHREIFFGDGVALVEWADRAPELLPEDRLLIEIEILGHEERSLTVTAIGRAARVLEGLRRAWPGGDDL